MTLAVIASIVLVLAGLLVLALYAVQLWRQVKRLGTVVSTSSERIADATAALDAVAPSRERPGV